MQYEWDENKRRTNLEKHGEDFADVDRLDWSRAHIEPDTRHSYGAPDMPPMSRAMTPALSVSFSPLGTGECVISATERQTAERKKV